MNDLAETLQQEHLTIRDSLDVIGALVDALDRGNVPPPEDLNAVLDFMDGFTDRSHRAKEEAVFSELVRTSDASVRPLIHRLEVEHAMTRKIVSAMRALVPRVEAGDHRARQEFEMYLRSYRFRTRDHIRDETRQLMPLVESTSRSSGHESMVRELDRIANEDFGDRGHGRLRETIRRLASKYSLRVRDAA